MWIFRKSLNLVQTFSLCVCVLTAVGGASGHDVRSPARRLTVHAFLDLAIPVLTCMAISSHHRWCTHKTERHVFNFEGVQILISCTRVIACLKRLSNMTSIWYLSVMAIVIHIFHVLIDYNKDLMNSKLIIKAQKWNDYSTCTWQV